MSSGRYRRVVNESLGGRAELPEEPGEQFQFRGVVAGQHALGGLEQRLEGQCEFGFALAGSLARSGGQIDGLQVRRGEELGAELRIGIEAEVLGQDDGGVNVRLRDADDRHGRGDGGREEADGGHEQADAGRERIVRADYVVAADGHRGRTREGLGIGVHGRGVLSTAMSSVFEADLSWELRGRGVMLYHMRGSLPGATYATTDDPGRHNVHVGIGEGPGDEARCVQAVRTVTGRGGPCRRPARSRWKARCGSSSGRKPPAGR
jgi:hypothetical protein